MRRDNAAVGGGALDRAPKAQGMPIAGRKGVYHVAVDGHVLCVVCSCVIVFVYYTEDKVVSQGILSHKRSVSRHLQCMVIWSPA